MKQSTYPILLKITAGYLEEFVNCEMGAHEDELTGPSPLTTVTILSRHDWSGGGVNTPQLKRRRTHIELRTVEEATQVLDCCLYGTFPLHFPKVAARLENELWEIPGVKEMWRVHNDEQFGALANLVRIATGQS